MKVFNTTGLCSPALHYMAGISENVKEIKKLVDSGKYFTINRARQYGKTTTLNALERMLADSYYVVSMDFQDYGEDTFSNEDAFCRDFSVDYLFRQVFRGNTEKDKSSPANGLLLSFQLSQMVVIPEMCSSRREKAFTEDCHPFRTGVPWLA